MVRSFLAEFVESLEKVGVVINPDNNFSEAATTASTTTRTSGLESAETTNSSGSEAEVHHRAEESVQLSSSGCDR